MFPRRFLPVVLVATLFTLAGCATPGPQIRTEFDRSVDLTQYKSFAFFSPLATDRQGYQTVVSQYLKAATRRELEARGLRYDEAAPQLLVNFGARLNDKLRVDQVPATSVGMSVGFGRGYYGYRGGLYGAWPMYPTETQVTSYQEGTLNVDLVDPARNSLVWEGIAVGRVTQRTLDDLQPAIDSVVSSIFAEYPVPATGLAPEPTRP